MNLVIKSLLSSIIFAVVIAQLLHFFLSISWQVVFAYILGASATALGTLPYCLSFAPKKKVALQWKIAKNAKSQRPIEAIHNAKDNAGNPKILYFKPFLLQTHQHTKL